MRAPARLVVIAVVLAGVACGDGGSGPSSSGPGGVDLMLDTPYADDGGLLITVTGAPVTSVGSDRYELSSTTAGSNGVTLLLRGDITGGVIARLVVPDRGRLGGYQVKLLQAAARGPGHQQRGLANYKVRLVVP